MPECVGRSSRNDSCPFPQCASPIAKNPLNLRRLPAGLALARFRLDAVLLDLALYRHEGGLQENAIAENGLDRDATVCTNEYGVAMEMSITSFSNKAALEADPLVEHGLSEFTAVDLVVCQSKTAREAVEVLTGLIDEYGSSEVNIALIADQSES